MNDPSKNESPINIEIPENVKQEADILEGRPEVIERLVEIIFSFPGPGIPS